MDERVAAYAGEELPSTQDVNNGAAKPAGASTAKYKKWYQESCECLGDWRETAKESFGFYHGGKRQWRQDDIDTLEKEKRPVLSINRIKPTIDLQKGIEIRSRTDIDAKPRGATDGPTADAITAGFKYIQDQNQADHLVSDVFFDGLGGGIGWIEIGENQDPTAEEVQIRYADWRNVGWDPHARHMLLDDSRYMYIDRWLDLDVAKATWPEKANELQTQYDEQRQKTPHINVKGDQYKSNVGWVDSARARVLVIQMYFKKCEPSVFLRYRDGSVKETTKESLALNTSLVSDPNVYKVIQRLVDRIYSVIFTCDTILESESKIQSGHNYYPLIPFICYMDDDGKPYGMVENMKDPQREINKNRSQFSHILSTRRVFWETGSITNPQDSKEQISRPDAWIQLNAGALQYKKFQFSQDSVVAAEHFKIMQEAKRELQEISGAVEEQMGQQTNARSGVAIEARQRQGATINTEPFDNLRLMKHRMGELMLAEMRRLWTYEKVIRITEDTTGSDKWVTFNKDGVNVVTQGRYDIVVSEHAETETTRNWVSRTMMEFATRMTPDIALPVLQASFEASDLPNKEKILEKLKAAEEKQDRLTQQKLFNEAAGNVTPAAAPAKEEPKPMGPPQPGITADEVLKKIMAGETWGGITVIKDTTAEKAAEFVKAPKPPTGGVTPGSPTKA